MPVPATLRKAVFRSFDQARAFARVLSAASPCSRSWAPKPWPTGGSLPIECSPAQGGPYEKGPAAVCCPASPRRH